MPSKRVKWLLYGGLIVLFLFLLATAILLLFASAVPADYKPILLPPRDRQESAEHLLRNYLAPFWNNFQKPEPFEVTVREEDLNRYLASLDEIHANRPTRAGEDADANSIYQAMDQAGLSDPVVAMHDGRLTFMVKERRAHKVISIDLTFHPTDDGRMAVRLEQIRVGRLPVPRALVDETLAQLKDQLGDLTPTGESNPGLETFIASLISAIDEGPRSTDLTIRDRTKRTHRIEISEKEATIFIIPVETPDED